MTLQELPPIKFLAWSTKLPILLYRLNFTFLISINLFIRFKEVADLNTELKKRLNISDVQYAAAPMAAAAAPAAAPAAEAAPEAEPEVEEVKVQTEFSLTMTGFDESKKVKGF